MELYLFPELLQDPVIRQLLALQDGNCDAGELYPRLLDFVSTRAFTRHTVREYVLRALLGRSLGHWSSAAAEPYLMWDIVVLYNTFFTRDWDLLCAETGRLPLPSGQGKGSPGESSYREFITDMVQATDAEQLSFGIHAFYRSYRDEAEAMYRAFRWNGELTGIRTPDPIGFDDLWGLEHQKEVLLTNTGAFVKGLPANDILLVGGGGTGKSSCVKAVLNHFVPQGLRLVEYAHPELSQLPALLDRLAEQQLRYIIFLDDLSFGDTGRSFLALKVALDGRLAKRPDNVLIYATSNRRRLIRESWRDRDDGDIHENDAVNEKLSLSERFGIRLYFPYLSQQEYLQTVYKILTDADVVYTDEIGAQAVAWAGMHNGRSGRSARQFVAHYLGSQ